MSEQAPHAQLTPAEREVLRHLIEGAHAAEVARSRGVSPHTIRTQVSAIHRKLGVATTTAAVVWGIAHRECCLVPPWEGNREPARQDDLS